MQPSIPQPGLIMADHMLPGMGPVGWRLTVMNCQCSNAQSGFANVLMASWEVQHAQADSLKAQLDPGLMGALCLTLHSTLPALTKSQRQTAACRQPLSSRRQTS